MNKKLHITFSCITLIIGVIIAIFGALSFNTVSFIFNNETYTEWHSGWARINPDGTTEELFIPCTVEASPGEPVVIENVIPDDYVPNRSISLRLSMQELKVELDDEVIFNLRHNEDFLTKSVGSSWQVVSFPSGSEGKTVRITLTAPYEMSSGTINNINMGTKCAVSFAIFKAHFPRLLIALFIFFFGALFLILGYVFRTLGSDVARITYLGLFSILVSLWLACESRMLQFFIGNHFIITSLVFIALMLLPLPMLMYLESAYEKHHRNHYPYFIWAFIINFLVCVFLQFTKIADFFETITSTHVLIFVSMIYFVCSALYEVIRYKNSSALANLISVSVLCFFSALELFNFYAGSFAYVTDFFAAGIMVYIFMLCFDTYRYVHMLFEKSAEAKHFERLANFDALTNGKNRLSFDNDLALLWKNDIPEETWLCFFDLNDLKMINDTFGHHIGDMALKKTYECISMAFGPDENCYRVGGDEFACIVHGPYSALTSRLNIFNSEVSLVGKKVAFPFKIATGYVPVDKEKYESVQDMLIDVDMRMYQDKSEKKH